jgi:hypothetical protein
VFGKPLLVVANESIAALAPASDRDERPRRKGDA